MPTLPGMPGVRLSAVQVSLRRLLRLLNVTGSSPGFDLSSAVVPIVDVSRLVELEGDRANYLRPDIESDGYMGEAEVAASVGNPDLIQLWNPIGSGVVVLLQSASAFHSQVSDLMLRYSGVQAANLHANVMRSKSGFGAHPTLQLRWQNAPQGGLLQRRTYAANTTSIWEFLEPIRIRPGVGVAIETISLNLNLTANFECRVVPEV